MGPLGASSWRPMADLYNSWKETKMSPDQKPTKPIDLYLRVSRVGGREGDSYISPELQEERCRAFLTANGYTAGEVFIDEDESGRKMTRPAFDQAIERALTGISGGIVVWKLSRFGRSTQGVLDGVQALEAAGAALLSTSENLDTSNPMGRFVLTIFAALAELESETIREGWVAANARALDKGIHVSSRVPAGYERDPETRVLRPSPYAPAILAAFEARADGATWIQVAKILTDAGVPKSRETDSPTWSEFAAAALCENRVYLGEARAGKKGNVKKGAHPAIVSDGLFARVQARKGEKDSFVDPGRYREVFAGLVRCAGCGQSMVTDKRTKNGQVVQAYWRCSSRCESRAAVSIKALEGYVWKYVAEHGSELAVQAPRSNDAARAAAEIRLANAQAALDEFVANFGKQGLSAELAASMAATLEQERDDAAAALNETVEGETQDADWAGLPISDDGEDRVLVDLDLSSGTVAGQNVVWYLLSLNQIDNAKARRLVKQVVKRITVAKGRVPIAERVTVELI